MRNIFRRKANPLTDPIAVDVSGADGAYDDLDAAGLAEHNPILAALVVDWRATRGDVPVGAI